ncbi:MAG: endo alpha-1,4 polygalactosaminidase [Acidimicrobiales bacterium]
MGWLALTLCVPVMLGFAVPVSANPPVKAPPHTTIAKELALTSSPRHVVKHAKHAKAKKATPVKRKVKAPVTTTTITTLAAPPANAIPAPPVNVTGGAAPPVTTTTLSPPVSPPAPLAPPAATTTTSTTTTSTTSTTTTTLAPSPVTSGTWWHPPLGNLPWQWEIDHALNLASATDMGTNDTLPSGQPAPSPKVYDIDGIINPASTVNALHALGAHVVCYIEVGTAGNYYSASDEGVPTTYYSQYQAAGVFGNKLSGYPEYFLNINSPATVSITEAMITQQCAAKGFDAVETDLDETYSGSDGATGFNLTQANEITYMSTLANYMHSLGLAWIIKNPDDTGDNYATLMEPLADGALTEQCNEYSTCSALSAYFGHKAIFNAEYNLSTSAFCAADIAADINGAKFPVALSGARSPCS